MKKAPRGAFFISKTEGLGMESPRCARCMASRHSRVWHQPIGCISFGLDSIQCFASIPYARRTCDSMPPCGGSHAMLRIDSSLRCYPSKSRQMAAFCCFLVKVFCLFGEGDGGAETVAFEGRLPDAHHAHSLPVGGGRMLFLYIIYTEKAHPLALPRVPHVPGAIRQSRWPQGFSSIPRSQRIVGFICRKSKNRLVQPQKTKRNVRFSRSQKK